MELVGTGFIARNLGGISGKHPGSVVLAAGVSSTHTREEVAFARERHLVGTFARRCAQDGRLLVVLSTATHAMYGSTDLAVAEQDPVDPRLPYGIHKRAVEGLVETSGARFLILRLSHVVGIGQPSHQLLPSLVEQVHTGTVKLFQGAHRDLVDVEDVAAAIDSLLENRVEGEIVNVASGSPHPISEIAGGVAERLGLNPEFDLVEAEPVRTVVSIDRLRSAAPGAAPSGGAEYLDHILDKYVDHYRRAKDPRSLR
jgi:nucleoside-diphosphate-sugar epimerase